MLIKRSPNKLNYGISIYQVKCNKLRRCEYASKINKSFSFSCFKGHLRKLYIFKIEIEIWNFKRMNGKYRKSTKVLRLKCQPSWFKMFMVWKFESHVNSGNYSFKYMWFKTFILNNYTMQTASHDERTCW